MSEEELCELLPAEVYAGGVLRARRFRTRTGFGTPGRRSRRSLHGIQKGDMLYFTYNKIPHASGRMRKSELQRKNF